MAFKRCICGSEIFYIRQRVSGICDFYVKCNGEEVDNGGLHDDLIYTNISKYYRCENCDRFAIEDKDI